jgi:hypothetical protein
MLSTSSPTWEPSHHRPAYLYLYIPHTSSHPASCFTGTIVGNILRFWRQNLDLSHYRRLVSEFATHFIDRGYTIPTVERAMLSAAANSMPKQACPRTIPPVPTPLPAPNASIYTGVTVPSVWDETPSATYSINTSLDTTDLMKWSMLSPDRRI